MATIAPTITKHANVKPNPPPPHSGVGGTACVFPKSPVKGYFSRDNVRPENCILKKGGVFDFSPGDFLKRGGVFFSLSLKGGYKISLFTLFENHRKIYQIPVSNSWNRNLGGLQGRKSPRKGGSDMSWDRGVLSDKGRERAYAYPK